MAAACRHASAHTRGTMVAALKFAIARHSGSDACRASIGEFTALLADADIGVRRQAFLTLNAVLHSAFDLVADRLGAILPMVFAETAVHPELIREVDLGPFKRRIDDGFPLRKAAFQCMDTLVDVVWGSSHGGGNGGNGAVDVSPDALPMAEFVRRLHDGLCDDENDIQLLTYQVLATRSE
jgi:hypothetical protein